MNGDGAPRNELVGNKAIEDAAVAWVMELERDAGGAPRDTRFAGAPADIDSPPRVIEVKAFGGSNRGYDLWLEPRQDEEAATNPNFYVYVVENVRQGDPEFFTLKVLGGERHTPPQPLACRSASPRRSDRPAAEEKRRGRQFTALSFTR